MSDDFEQAVRKDLDRRLVELESSPDEAFGRLGTGEWVFAIAVFVVGPIALVLAFA